MRLLLLLLCFLPFGVIAQLHGKVIAIADGDTFTLLDNNNAQIKIRFHGIDCPEGGQPFGQVCKKYLSDLIYGKQVKVVTRSKDRYGRTLGYVYLDTVLVNRRMIAAGMAWHFTRYDQQSEWQLLEDKARRLGLGLWKDKNPIPPWEWRKTRRH